MQFIQTFDTLKITWVDVFAVFYFFVSWLSYARFASVKTKNTIVYKRFFMIIVTSAQNAWLNVMYTSWTLI